MDKSPFYVIQEFISPMMCEDILDLIDYNVPDVDKDDNPVQTTRNNERAEGMIYERVLLALPEIQAYYKFLYKGMERVSFEWFPAGSCGKHHAENSQFLRKKWLRTLQRDFTGVLFLSDYQSDAPFDSDYEVLGGLLEFPQHNFKFHPQRGTLVIFPSDPHFINITSEVFAGDLFQARIQLAANTSYLYDPSQFPGNFTTWFKPLLNQ